MSHWLHPVLVLVEEAQVEIHGTHQLQLIADLAHAYSLIGENNGQVDLPPPDTDLPTLGDARRAVMVRILGFITVGLVSSPFTPLDQPAAYEHRMHRVRGRRRIAQDELERAAPHLGERLP